MTMAIREYHEAPFDTLIARLTQARAVIMALANTCDKDKFAQPDDLIYGTLWAIQTLIEQASEACNKFGTIEYKTDRETEALQ
jgi:hypothetical protein